MNHSNHGVCHGKLLWRYKNSISMCTVALVLYAEDIMWGHLYELWLHGLLRGDKVVPSMFSVHLHRYVVHILRKLAVLFPWFGAIPFAHYLRQRRADTAVPHRSRGLVGWRINLLSERKTSSMLMHVLGGPLIQHFSTARSKNTWHFRASGAGPQNKNRARAFPLGHWDRGNPWTSVCEASGETGPVYFGRCLTRDGHELNVRLRRATSRLGKWQRKQLLRTRRPCRHGNPHGTVWWGCSLALKIYGSGKGLFKRLCMTLSLSLSCTQEKKCRRGGRGWGKTEMDAFCARHSVLSHIVALCSICRPESRKSAVYTSVRVLLHVNSQP